MIKVRKDNPCPVCGKTDWCLVEEDKSAAICQRISDGSVRKMGEAGWLHKFGDKPAPVRKYRPKPKTTVPAPDFSKEVRQCQQDLTDYTLLAKDLGVSEASLGRLNVGFFEKSQAYSFPMRDGRHQFVGIRLRATYGKFSVVGSKNALFWPMGVNADSNNILFLPEGPTDTAAMLDMGLDAVGRPNNRAGAQYLKEMIERFERTVVVMADKDEAKYTTAGDKFYPGIEGAIEFAKEIKPFVRSVRVIKPPHHKDIRKWYQDGCTAAKVMILVDNARFI